MKTIYSELETLEQMLLKCKTQGAKEHLRIRIDRIKAIIVNESDDDLLFI